MPKLTYACALTRNIDGLADFYREVLRVDPTWTGATYAEFATGPSSFCLWALAAYEQVAGPAVGLGAGSVMLEFEVDDVDAEYARLRGKVDFIIPPTTMPWGNRSIYFRDPDGNMLNLFSRAT